ncbi:MAG: GNAT family N-acetyltransferase, partial [Bacteroidota bacterium]
MEIFPATAFDLLSLSELFNQYRIFYKQTSDVDAATSFLKERMEKKDSVIYIAAEEDVLTGFVQLYPLFSSVQMKPMWLLNDLFVDAAHRKKGIARALIAEAKQHTMNTNACGIMLETTRNNKEGNALYP